MNNPLIKYEKPMSYYINALDEQALYKFKNLFYSMAEESIIRNKKLIILCIGTDRITGDCLGPIVGYKLKKMNLKENIVVFGCLEKPVHAQNLCSTILDIKTEYPDSLIVAVDSCIGKAEHISHICIGEGSIKPGAGLRKDLPPVGDVFITGIVNSSAVLDICILQNTRLNVVMQMADIISDGIAFAVNDIRTPLTLRTHF